MVTSSSPLAGPKGRPPPRKCPADFSVIFVEQGRLECEAWYRASRSTVNRWLAECGEKQLIAARAAYVAHQRAAGEWMTRSTKLVTHREVRQAAKSLPVRDRRKVSETVARGAARFLRIVRNGGFIVSPTGKGDWWVGSRRLSPAQMVDLAASKGFDAAAVREETEEEQRDQLLHRPERLASGRPVVMVQRPDASTYIPNSRKQQIIRKGNLHRDDDGEVEG